MAVQKAVNRLRVMGIWRCTAELIFSAFLCSAVGCASGWHGRIVHLEDGKVIIQPQGEGEIESGRKLVIYREKSIVHPITGEVLDNISDNITEAPVLRVGKHTLTVKVEDPWFSMIELDDQAKLVRGSVEISKGSVREVGLVRDLDTADKVVEVDIAPGIEGFAGGVLRVIKYVGTVMDPDTGEVLAVAVEPVARLNVRTVDAGSRLQAHYELIDEKLGWIEMGDIVARLDGDMLNERLWFQDPPDGFSDERIFGRNYLHALRHYDSGYYREAMLGLNDVIQIDPEYRDTRYLLGLCYANLDRHEEAAEHFRSSLEQKPDDAKTWAALAYSYLKQEKKQEAVEAYEKLANLMPDDPGVWTDMGDIYQALGNRQKAEQAYRKALEIDEDNEAARYELQKILATD